MQLWSFLHNNIHTNAHVKLYITHLYILAMQLMPTNGFTCTASSDFGQFYLCSKAYDNNTGTSWLTNREGVGAWISVQFHLTTALAKLEIRHPYGGYHTKFNIKEIRLTFSDDGETTTQDATLSPSSTPEWNVVNIDPAVKTSSVKIEFRSAYVPSATQLRGFSEIEFYEGSGNT